MWITTNYGKFFKRWEYQNHLTCFLRNLYAGQEATARTGHGTTDWFQVGKGVHQGCILSPCLLNLYAEYIMQSAGLDEAQAGIKIAGRNINYLRYVVGEGNGNPLQYSCLENPRDEKMNLKEAWGTFGGWKYSIS